MMLTIAMWSNTAAKAKTCLRPVADERSWNRGTGHCKTGQRETK